MHRHSYNKQEFSIKKWKAALILLAVALIIFNSVLIFYYKNQSNKINIVSNSNLSSDSFTVSQFKIIKQEGIRSTNTIKGVVKNINGTISDVTINAKLYYARNVVAEKSITLRNVKLYEERDFEINFEKNVTWNSFKLEII